MNVNIRSRSLGQIKCALFIVILKALSCSTEYCEPSHLISKISTSPECYYKGHEVSCNDSIIPGTQAKLSCTTGFVSPPAYLYQILNCKEDGTWDNAPYSCNMECGRVAPKTQEISIAGKKINVTEVPWYVAIYMNGTFICSGTLITPNLVITVASYLWNVDDVSIYSVAAGKSFGAYDSTNEVLPVQKRDISEIHIPSSFEGLLGYRKDNIAIVKLKTPFTLTDSIRPVCLEFLEGAEKEVQDNMIGQFASWDWIDDHRSSDVLKIVTMKTLSFNECYRGLKVKNPNFDLEDDKFCLFSDDGSTSCRGDSGTGFVVPSKDQHTDTVYYKLVGIVSSAVTSNGNCAENGTVALTNVQFFKKFIEPLKIASQAEL